MYIEVNSKAEVKKAVEALEALGLVPSQFGADKDDDVRGVATFLYRADNGHCEKKYILLTSSMMVDEPHFSWTAARKRMDSLEDMLSAVKEFLLRK